MKVDMNLRGIEDVDNLLSQIAPREAQNIMRSTVHAIASDVAKEAKADAPSDGPPRTLRRAIKAKREKVRYGKIASTVRVKRDAFYWRFLEYGTVKMRERPFFAPAVERLRTMWTQRFLQAFVKKFEATLARRRRRG